MPKPNDMNSNDGFDGLPTAIASAIEAVRGEALQQASIERTLCRLKSRPPAIRSRPVDRRSLVAASIAAALLASATAWLWRPAASWAEVAKALRGKPWIHGTRTREDGQDTPPATSEFWFSAEREVYADRRDRWAMFDDYRLDVRYEYDPAADRIVRQMTWDKEAGKSLRELWEGLMSGDLRPGLNVNGEQLVGQESREVVEDGRHWLEYDLIFRANYDWASNTRTRTRFRVDPQTHLPHSMIRSWLGAEREPLAADRSVECTFDYPDEGPRDIYDLGVPRAAAVDDRVPNDDLSRILAAVESARNDFDSYFGIVVSGEGPWHTGMPETIVWRKGNRWRAEIGGLTVPPPAPEAGADPVTWWNEQLKNCVYQPIEVCDGETVYRVEFDEPGANGKQTHTWRARHKIEPGKALDRAGQARLSMPELFGYPTTLQPASHVFTVDIDPRPAEGPSGSLLVEYLATPALKDPGVFRCNRYWVDAAKGYVTRQHVLADSGLPEADDTNTYIMEDFQRSPRGIWFPTVVRRKNAIQFERDGRQVKQDQVWRFYLDFEAEIPDSLFRPVDRPPQK